MTPASTTGGDASGDYWFCLTHHTVEGRGGCPNTDRLGPYPSEATAARALEIVEERNRAWDEADECWGRGQAGRGDPPASTES